MSKFTGEGSESIREKLYIIEVDQNPFEVAIDDDFYSVPLPLNVALGEGVDGHPPEVFYGEWRDEKARQSRMPAHTSGYCISNIRSLYERRIRVTKEQSVICHDTCPLGILYSSKEQRAFYG